MVRCKKWYAFKRFLIVFGRFSSVFGRPIFFQATSRRSNFFSRHLPFFSIFAAAAAAAGAPVAAVPPLPPWAPAAAAAAAKIRRHPVEDGQACEIIRAKLQAKSRLSFA